MSADVTPLRPDWPLPHAADGDANRQWWLTYNTGFADGVQSVLDRLGLSGVDLDEVADTVTVAGYEPLIRTEFARRHLRAVPS